MAKQIKNIDTVEHIWGGVGIPAGETYTCANQSEINKFVAHDQFIIDLANGKAEVYSDSVLVVGPANAINILKTSQYEISSMPAAAAKTLPDGKKLYKRVVGKRQTINQGVNEILWACPFNWVKFMGVELTGTKHGDYVDLYVLDRSASSPLAPLYGVNDLVLNQFGFEANMFENNYQHKSEFDADLYKDLQIKIVYNSIDAKTVPVGFNFIMNEVK